MTLVNYSYHANPSSHHDVLAKLKTFAEANGWTSNYYNNQNKIWGATGSSPPYGWISGSESHLSLSSTGYGSNDLHMRFRCEATGSDPSAEIWWMSGINPGTSTTPDGSSSTEPQLQNSYTSHLRQKIYLSPGTMSAVWFFGNARFVMIALAIDTSFMCFMHFGMPEMFKTNSTNTFYRCNTGHHWDSPTFSKWYDAFTYPTRWRFPHEYKGNITYPSSWDVAAGNNHPTWHWSTACNLQAEGQATPGYFNNCIGAIKLNPWTGKRTMINPVVFLQREIDSVWFPVGYWPWFYTPFGGLGFGDTLTYGSEEYLVFPDYFSTRTNGIAFRVV